MESFEKPAMMTFPRYPWLSLALLGILLAAGPAGGQDITAPTREDILAVAKKVLAEVAPKLSPEQKMGVDQTFFTLSSKKTVPAVYAVALDELLNHCTVALSHTRSMESLIVTSARLVELEPEKARVTNMMGVILHAIGRNEEAIKLLQYTIALKPKSELALLNAASIWLDLGQDDRAKASIDAVIALNPGNKSAWSALATWWYKKGDLKKVVDALVKASSLGGGALRKKADGNKKTVEENRVAEADNCTILDKKTEALEGLVPKTTADIIEDRFPDQAREIRERYGRLIGSEKLIMPGLPMAATASLKGWIEKGRPVVKQWVRTLASNAEKAQREVAALEVGINPGDSKAEKRRKGKEAARKQVGQSLADAERMLEQMRAMGMPEAKIRQSEEKLKKAREKQGLDSAGPEAPSDKEVAAAEIKSDEDLRRYEKAQVIPGWDNGSVFAVTNYRDYRAILDTYTAYFGKYQEDLSRKVNEIVKVYREKLDAEYRRHEAAPSSSEEALLHKKTVNALGNDYFSQWSNIVYPQYRIKMKPKLDAFWAVCALYIKNMNDPEVMKAEYAKVKKIFWLNAMAAGTAVYEQGIFKYMGDTYQDELELERKKAQEKEEAEAREKEAEEQARQAQQEESALDKWLNDNFALGVAGEFLSLKITPRQFTVEEYIAGMNFKHVYDFKSGEWTMYRSFCAKIDVGIQVGPMKAGISARADILESYDVINTRSGKVVSAGSSFAKGGVEGSLGAGDLSVSGGATVTLDPAAESELSVQFNKSAGYRSTIHDKVEGGVDF
jgi:tetratricopeptide (TPR) repeat protein